MEETARQLIHRADKAVDFVVTAGTDLLINGHVTCNELSRKSLRELAISTGTVSNLFLITPNASCSSFEELGTPLPDSQERANWAIARNPAYRFGRMPNGTTSALGISWGLESDLELVAAINADAMLFDVLPHDLRSRSLVKLWADAVVVSSFEGSQIDPEDTIAWVSFSSTSNQYPLRAEVRIDPQAWASWRRDLSNSVAMTWIAIGCMVSGIAAFAASGVKNKALNDLKRALRNKEITPYLQPIVDLRTGKVVGCEALARWIKPSGDEVPPHRFIPLIEQYHLDDQLLDVMMRKAAAHCLPVMRAKQEFYLSFNVTPDQLSQTDFAEDFADHISRHSLSPEQVCVEVTERQILTSPVEVASTTEKLSAAGIRVAIDDAGTGHNGLVSMQSLAASMIKIDKFFIDQVHEDPRSRVMVDMFVSVARRYGMKTIAEGVESAAQFEVLRKAGVDAVQGYLFSRPVPAKDFASEMTNNWSDFSEALQADLGDAIQQQDVTELSALPRPAMHPPFDYPSGEASRLEALYRYQVLDTEEEEQFERIPRIIRNALDAPMAAVAFVDKDRRWFKAVSGGKRGELPRQHSFCNYTVQSQEPTIVPDTRLDPRFRDNLLVVEPPFVRAYLGVPLETPDGHLIGSVCCVDKRPRTFSESEVQLVSDLSSIVMEQLELRRQAMICPVTSILTRRGFRDEAELQLGISKRNGRPFSLIILDIDHFKQVNDSYGHGVGDEVLAHFADRTLWTLDDRAIFGRLGGEEFAIALPGFDLAEAYDCAEKVRAAIAETPFVTLAGGVSVQASLGVASMDRGSNDLNALLERADWAMYQAKNLGRNRVCVQTNRVAV